MQTKLCRLPAQLATRAFAPPCQADSHKPPPDAPQGHAKHKDRPFPRGMARVGGSDLPACLANPRKGSP